MSRFRRRLMGLAALRQAAADDYVRVEYIENSNLAYINTNFSISTNVCYSIDAVITISSAKAGYLIGKSGGNPYNASIGITDTPKFKTFCNRTTVNYTDYTAELDKKYHLTGSPKNLTVEYEDIDEETQEKVTKSFSFTNDGRIINSKQLSIFNIIGYVNTSNAFYGRIYSFKLYNQSGTLVRDFIPMYQISTDTYGLWDRVNDKFYSSANSYKFTGGERVIADANENLYYLKNYIYINSTQQQYIILKPFTENDNVELKVYPIGATNYWFGDRTGNGAKRLQIASWNNTRLDIARNQFPSITYSKGIINKDITLKLDGKQFYVNNELLYTFTSTLSTTNNTNLGRVYNTGRNTNSIFYWFKWWNKNKDLIYDLIPVQRCSDNVWGFFDKVSLVFHPSNGTEQFTGG